MNEQNNKFIYTYSAPSEEERREINRIRKEYLTPDKKDSKIEQLRKLDKRVRSAPVCLALSLGIIGLLTFGLGLTFALEWNDIVIGTIVSIIGTLMMILAFPTYKYVLKKNKNIFGKEILSLSDEILNETDKNS